MALFDILVNIAASSAQFQSEMKKVTSTLEEVGEVAKTALEFTGVAVGLNELRESFTNAAEGAEQLQQLSERMGETTASLSQLQFAAQATNVPFATLTGALNIMQRNLVQASEGGGRAKQALADLGIDASKLAALPLDAQLDIIADRIKSLPSPTEQTAAAMRLFGAAGAELLPLLRDGSAGIDEMRAKADALGVTMGTETVQSLAKANTAITNLKASFRSFATEVAGDVAPAVTGFLDKMTQSLSSARTRFDAVTGSGSWQAQVTGLEGQAKDLQTRIDNIKNSTDWISTHNPFNASLLQDYSAELKDINKQIADLTPLEPVTVTAQKVVSAGPDLTDIVVRATKINEDYMQQYYDKLNTMSESDVQSTVAAWDEKENAARQLYADGIIDATEFQNRLEAINDSFLQPVQVTAKTITQSVKDHYADMQKYAQSAAQSIQGSFATFLEDPSISGFKKMADAWLETLDKMVADAAASGIFQLIFGANTPGGGLSGLLSSGLGALFGGGGSSLSTVSSSLSASADTGIDSVLMSVPGMKNGGSWNVGGSGGVDSQLVAFKATPGENVQVGQSGGGYIDARTYVTVTSPEVTKQDVVMAVAQGQSSTISKMQDMKRRGSF